ncbi:hypothetical protein Tco_1082588, partial [Tanacetum coccineum]
FTHFRIHGKSLDDVLVPLMKDDDAIILLKYVPRCTFVLIEKIVKDNDVSIGRKESRLSMLEWPEIGKEENHVDTLT